MIPVKVILFCENCQHVDENELDLNEVAVTIDVPNSQYVFETICSHCGGDIHNTLKIGAI